MTTDAAQQPPQPDYLTQFCPILSHAVLSPAAIEKPTKQVLVPLGNEAALPQPPAVPETEYIGCQGPSCAFFLRGEGRCCLPLLTQAMGAIISLQYGDKLNLQPSQH